MLNRTQGVGSGINVGSIGTLFSLANEVRHNVRDIKKTNASKNLLPTAHAKEIVVKYSKIATAVGASPIPFSDTIILAPTQIAMFLHINRIYGVEINNKTLSSFILGIGGVVGASYAGRMIVSSVFKLVPGIGSIAGGAINAFTARALTIMLGKAYIKMMQKHSNTLKNSDVNAEQMLLLLKPFLRKSS